MIVGAEEDDPERVAVGLASCGSRLATLWVTSRPTASSAVGLLSFSQTISLSLLNDKKKEVELKKNGRGCRQEGRNGREKEIEGRRRNGRKKKK